MALKLLVRKDAPLEHPELGVRIRLGRLRPEHIAEIAGILRESHAPAITVGIYVLREVASEVEIAGEQYDPRALSYQVDPRDPDTAAALTAIAALAVEELLAGDEQRKKSIAPPAPGGAASGAAAAH